MRGWKAPTTARFCTDFGLPGGLGEVALRTEILTVENPDNGAHGEGRKGRASLRGCRSGRRQPLVQGTFQITALPSV